MRCARHPKVETALSCSRCGTPICPDCSISAPVGFRCRDCAALRSSPLYQVSAQKLALAAALGTAASVVVGVVLQSLGFFVLIAAPFLGGIVGDLILRVTGRKQGPKLEFLAGACVVVGAALSSLLLPGGFAALHSPVSMIWFLLSVGLAAAAAVGRIRYL